MDNVLPEHSSSDFLCKLNSNIIEITILQHTENSYRQVIEYILEISENILTTYQIDFIYTNKKDLPENGLPPKGINIFFTNAYKLNLISYIEDYAKYFIKLGFGDQALYPVAVLTAYNYKYMSLLVSCIDICENSDDDLLNILKFLPLKHDITEKTFGVVISLILVTNNSEKISGYDNKFDTAEALILLLKCKHNFKKYIPKRIKHFKNINESAFWENILKTIWGESDGYKNVIHFSNMEKSSLLMDIFIDYI